MYSLFNRHAFTTVVVHHKPAGQARFLHQRRKKLSFKTLPSKTVPIKNQLSFVENAAVFSFYGSLTFSLGITAVLHAPNVVISIPAGILAYNGLMSANKSLKELEKDFFSTDTTDRILASSTGCLVFLVSTYIAFQVNTFFLLCVGVFSFL